MFLKVIVFVSGAAIMILELTGARVLAPYLGTSIIVWTSLLGIVMASLSAGYYLGGKAVDRAADYKSLALIILLAGLSVSMAAVLKSTLLFYIQAQIADIRWASLVAAFMLFSPANIFLGAISPYAVKLYFSDSNRIGTTVGNLYAISTVGSIVGTYLTGFLLISYFGNTNILFSLAALLVFMSLLTYPVKVTSRCIVVLILSAAPLFNSTLSSRSAASGFIDVDTRYNRVWIWDVVDSASGRPVRMLSTGADYIQSAMFLDGDDLALEYTDFFKVSEYFNQDILKALMIGGGAYSYPRDFLLRHKNATMDVVEIDPDLTRLAKEFFNLTETMAKAQGPSPQTETLTEVRGSSSRTDSPRLSVFHGDGRIFINNTENKYDAIFIDAFSLAVPFHLTTKEFVSEVFDRLNGGGVVAMNLISSIGGDKGKFLRAEYATYKQIFDQVYVFPVQDQSDGFKPQNIILVAIKSDGRISGVINSDVVNSNKFKKYLNNLWTAEISADVSVLTDDFAPVDQYLAKIIRK